MSTAPPPTWRRTLDDAGKPFYTHVATGFVTRDASLTARDPKIQLDSPHARENIVVGEVLGAGVYGTVYAATVRGDATRWALKSIRDARDGHARRELDSFFDVMRCVEEAGDPECARFFPRVPDNEWLRNGVLDIILVDDGVQEVMYRWCMMERALGPMVRSQTPLSPRDVVRFTVQTIQAVSVLNAQGFLHNDLHMGNIMVKSPEQDPQCSIMLIDFGFLSKAGSVGRPGNRVTWSKWWVRSVTDSKGFLGFYNDVEAALYNALLCFGVPSRALSDPLVKGDDGMLFAVAELHAAQPSPELTRVLEVLMEVRGANTNTCPRWSPGVVNKWCAELLGEQDAAGATARIDWPAFRVAQVQAAPRPAAADMETDTAVACRGCGRPL